MDTKTLRAFTCILILFNIGISMTWWNDSWQYRRKVDFPGNATNQTLNSVNLEIDSFEWINRNRLKDNCKDIVLVNSERIIESHLTGCGTRSALLSSKSCWNNSLNDTYVYYGNPLAAEDNKSALEQDLFEDEFEDGENENGTFKQKYKKKCKGLFCEDKGEYSQTLENEERNRYYWMRASAREDFGSRHRKISAETSTLITEPVFSLNRSGTIYLSTEREANAHSRKGAGAKYHIYITDGSKEKMLLQDKRGDNTDHYLRNSVGKIQFDAERRKINYSYNWDTGGNNVTLEELRELDYTDQNVYGNGGSLKTNSFSTNGFEDLKLKLVTIAAANAPDGGNAGATMKLKVYFIKRDKGEMGSTGIEEALPYYGKREPVIKASQKISNHTKELNVTAQVKMNNSGELDYVNETLKLKDVGIERSEVVEPRNHTFSIKSNESKKVSLKMKIPIGVEESGRGGEKIISISTNFSHHVENTTFSYKYGKNWKNVTLYKCKLENASLCTPENMSGWRRVSYYIRNDRIIREGDSLSTLKYLVSYEVKEESSSESQESGNSGSGGSSSSGGSGGGSVGYHDFSTPQEPEEELENASQIPVERSVDIINPAGEVNTSFKVKVRVVNDEECIVKVDDGSWSQMTEEQGLVVKGYSEIEEGEHTVEVKCLYTGDSTNFRVKGEKEVLDDVSTELTGSAVRKAEFSLESLTLILVLLTGVVLALYVWRRKTTSS